MTKLMAARQDVVTRSCRVNTGVTRLLKGHRSLAHWLSDRRRLLCSRAGSAAARLNQSDIVVIFSIRLELTKILRVWLRLMRGTSVSCLTPRIFVMFAFCRAAANSGANVSGEFGGDDATDRLDYRAVIKGSMDIED